MGMGHKYIANFLPLFPTECKRNAACIHSHTFIDEKTSQALV